MSREVASLRAYAKINLALVVGDRRSDGYHELLTVLQRIDLADTVTLEPHDTLLVEGFAEDSLVRGALTALAAQAGEEPSWRVTLDKAIPVAAGLGGGSADAAAALLLANPLLERPLPHHQLHAVAAAVGSDVPFFLESGPQLAWGRGVELKPLALPQEYWVVLALPHGAEKPSTAEIYRRFDLQQGAEGYAIRRAALERALVRCRAVEELALLPTNDLASAAQARQEILGTLRAFGALRTDLSGAGPALFGLFLQRAAAERAAAGLESIASVWVTGTVW